ncbi:SWI/SNF complex 60 kDa subunit [Leucogyrophana mollusca]|uniref:SWI/SNF complex 60 kDa subunit n=1 Tax=Leucogyrophana mollusca TaxID=85980 RepID=A0ACB8BG27_9AGAM|nr:SWI/SNF complex 60 kDa subunit [Leucogyrophana mollusca]
MDPLKATKKRKLTDKAVPNAFLQVPEFAEDSKMYQSLLEMEKRLDWTMMRKKVEVQDALARNPTTTRMLRIFLSHTVSGQAWQVGESGGDGGEAGVNFETGQGIPAWSLKIEGRLLEIPNQRSRDRVPPRKFSTFIKRMVVELDRDPALYPDGNIMEWPRASNSQPPLDGFTVRRTGDQPTRIRIVIHLEQTPEQYKVSSELGNILGIKEDSRIGVIHTLWNYIKIHGLQDKVDRRRIRADDYLRPIFGGDGITFQQLPELVNRYLGPPDPIVLHYTVNPGVTPPERPAAWDIEVKMEDTSLKSRMAATVHTSKESAQDLGKLDDEIALIAQSLHNSHTKRLFLQEFANDPAQFIQTWLASQSRDLESVLGSGPSEGATIRAEELRRSDFFRLPWVEEAVAVQEGMRLASKGMQ